MGALKINCYCTEKQMENIINKVVSHLNESELYDIPDFDEVYNNVRICLEFECFNNEVILKQSEILDSDWDLLYEDTAVLTSRLREYINDFNRNAKEGIIQSHHIKQDQDLCYAY